MKITQRSDQLMIEHYQGRGWIIFCIFSVWAIACYNYSNPMAQSMNLWIAATLVVLLAVFWGVNLQATIWIFEAQPATLAVQRRWLWNKRVSAESTYQWCEIRGVSTVLKDEGLYSVELMLSNAQPLLLCPEHALFLREAEKGEKAIASFLGIANPLDELGEAEDF